MKKFLILIVVLLGGCSTAYSFIPSVEHCDEVSYIRIGGQIDIVLKCQYER